MVRNVVKAVEDDNHDVRYSDYKDYGDRGGNFQTAYKSNYKPSGGYVTAPAKILVSGELTESDDTRVYNYFKYWEVYTEATDTTSEQLYTKCYFPEFNLTLYQNSIIKAVYVPEDKKPASPSAQSLADGISASVTFMENSRTQWTEDSTQKRISAYKANSVPDSYHNGGDRIYTDFLISFTYNDLLLNTFNTKQLNDATKMTPGLIVETAGDLPINAATGEYETKDQAYYAEHYGTSIDNSALETFIKSPATSSGNYLKSEFTMEELDNKNRINYYYSLPNISHSTLKETTRKNKVYRAYAYLRTSTGVVTVSLFTLLSMIWLLLQTAKMVDSIKEVFKR